MLDPACGTGGSFSRRTSTVEPLRGELDATEGAPPLRRGARRRARGQRHAPLRHEHAAHASAPRTASARRRSAPTTRCVTSRRARRGRPHEPPFGRKSSAHFVDEDGDEDRRPTTTTARLLDDDLEQAAQLRAARLQPLKIHGRAVVLPDNVLSRRRRPDRAGAPPSPV